MLLYKQSAFLKKYTLPSLASTLVLVCVLQIVAIYHKTDITTLTKIGFYNYAGFDDYKIFAHRGFDAPTKSASLPTNLQAWVEPTNLYDRNAYTSFDQFLEKNDTRGFLVLKDGNIIFEKYYNGSKQEDLMPSFSVAKSVVSLLVSSAIEDGFITNTDASITKYLPELTAGGFEKVTINQLLDMRTGLIWDEGYTSAISDVSKSYYTDDLTRYIQTLRVNSNDQKFEYLSGNTLILGVLLNKVLANTPHENMSGYFNNRIWKNIAPEGKFLWSLDRANGQEKAMCCLSSQARDYAKLGQLLLDNGKYNGVQLINPNWIQDIDISSVPEGQTIKYHKQFWISSKQENSFSAQGILGQYIYVNRNNNIVIVRLGHADGWSQDWTIWMDEWSNQL